MKQKEGEMERLNPLFPSTKWCEMLNKPLVLSSMDALMFSMQSGFLLSNVPQSCVECFPLVSLHVHRFYTFVSMNVHSLGVELSPEHSFDHPY